MSTLELVSRTEEKKVKVPVKIAVAEGDSIGPEIMRATLNILNEAGAEVEPEFIELGEKAYLAGKTSGIDEDAWDIIKNNKIILKAPITTPQGKGYKSLNLTLRKTLGLFANVRPVEAYSPFVPTHFPKMDVVIIRENEENLYAGIEHRQTQDVYQCLKLITRPGCERTIRYAFEYAKVYNRKKVTCMVKDNIMKITDGLFHKVFDKIAQEYPEIKNEVQIIDIGSAKLAAQPEDYDVMFEAIHGSAPDIAGKNIANPSGLLNAAISMLAHIGQAEIGDKIKNAWLCTIEQGYHTADIYREGVSRKKVGTEEFTNIIISNLERIPNLLQKSFSSSGNRIINIPDYIRKEQKKELVGVDVFLDWKEADPDKLGSVLSRLDIYQLKLKMITNRGVKVYPEGLSETYCTDHWRCRFVSKSAIINKDEPDYKAIEFEHILALQSVLHHLGYDVIKTENLYEFEGHRGFSLGQGE
ncbi:NADP-dependent isocitrate dehydrogenase [Flammeovirga sp. EKP202]|uniref:NADP-dependent isocitrate dehydrogenase n=1 Tax=Flammeovirga sp. EKP202 TaxID=2770592 RepID=UPI00165F6C73|nr:NADP-dependent isocitrate dehydrogenase [Flammeovirga sp. EKP202]MBD0402109.1 NADP-dependent isocitrate dehydrogenase [Flammeovirga sp. EKP202]